ncbi:MAG: hypothetical protein FWC06_08675 [Treponema sp.]|nr:hypothetical protein [Treponema sp.]
MKNKANDLHNILFEQLERLNDIDEDDINKGRLISEIQRAEAINKTAVQLIANSRLVLDAIKVQNEYPDILELPDMLRAAKTDSLPEPPKGSK